MTLTPADLAPHLAERLRPAGEQVLVAGEFVLYWMHHAVRAEENPALDTAIAAAGRLAYRCSSTRASAALTRTTPTGITPSSSKARERSRRPWRHGVCAMCFILVRRGRNPPRFAILRRARHWW